MIIYLILAYHDINPLFDHKFDDELHGDLLRSEFKQPSPLLTPEQNTRLADLIEKYWAVFDSRGLFIPVKDYEC